MTAPAKPTAFRLGDEVRAALANHNREWEQRWQRFVACVPPPRWHRAIPISAEWRALYEAYLPVSEYVRSLRLLARLVLPHPSWLPAALALPDLWFYLPPAFDGRVLVRLDQLPALLAALADPPQFGTADGRYPEQLATLRGWARRHTADKARLLDLGSGTGEGTREAAAILQEEGLEAQAVGVTREPLEAWMAATGQFPHRAQHAGETAALHSCRFLAGDAQSAPCRGPFDIILCNGLAGGRFLHTDTAYWQLLNEFRRLLAPGGLVLLGCRFHDGREQHLLRFRELAEANDWSATGTLRDLVLTPALQQV
jgi:SAM-dependent methyltransferase